MTLARPELMERRPTWGAGQRNSTSVHLEALGDENMRKLVDGTAQGLPDHVVDQIVERAEGVPLYAVETLRMLIDRGHLAPDDGGYRVVEPLDRLDVPPTLHSLIASRLDTLAADDRALLQDASVLGKTFTLDALGALTGRAPHELEPRLRALVRRELLTVEADSRSPEHGQFGFVQSLFREVAYGTLSKPARKERHLDAARYFEAIDEGELATVIASHLIDAHRAIPPGEEADEVAAQAQRWLVGAAERAASLGSYEQALSHVRSALGQLTLDRQKEIELLEQAGEYAANAVAYDIAKDALQRVIEGARELDDRPRMARAAARLGSVLFATGRPGAAVARLHAVVEQLGDDESTLPQAIVAAELARACFFTDALEDSLAWADRALPAAEKAGDVSVVTSALTTKGLVMSQQGRVMEGEVLFSGAAALASAHGLRTQELRAESNLVMLLRLRDPTSALARERRALEVARKLGLREWELATGVVAATLAILQGDWDWAEATLDAMDRDDLTGLDAAAIQLVRLTLQAFRGNSSQADRTLSDVAAVAHELDDVQLRLEIGLARANLALVGDKLVEAFENGVSIPVDRVGYGIEGTAVAARAALWRRDRAAAQTALERIDTCSERGAYVDCIRLGTHAGILALGGAVEEALDEYASLLADWRELGATFGLALCELDCVTLLGAGSTVADEAAKEARETFTRLGAKPFLDRLDRAVGAPQEKRA
ncbi:hypothetical protein BH24ACT26_BH24ACT26_23290 [soil metagenome]